MANGRSLISMTTGQRAEYRGRGKDIGIGDIQIAGIALANGATLATRNVKDFHGLDIPLVDPWSY